MLFGYFAYDWTILIVLPALIFTIFAQVKVNSSFEKFSKISTRGRLTGAEVARKILDLNGLYDVNIVANYCPNIVPNLDSPPYSAYELTDDGIWVDVSVSTDWLNLA